MQIITRIFIGNRPVLVVAEPELIKQILVKDFDVFSERNCAVTARHPILRSNLVEAQVDDWRRIRTIVSPAFSSFRMKKMFPLVRECVIEFLEVLDNSSTDSSEVNLVEAFGNLTMDVIATCAFATKVNAHRDPDNLFVKNARIIAKPNMVKTVAIQLLPNFMVKLLKIKSIFNENSNQFFFDLTRLILKQRKTGSADAFDDFIQLLLKAEQNLLDLNEDQDDHQAINGLKIQLIFLFSNLIL